MKLLRIEGCKRIRLLPWRYDEPAVLTRMFMLYGDKGEQVHPPVFDRDDSLALSPGTYGVPDPLWDVRRRGGTVLLWELFVAPCFEPSVPEVKLVRLPKSAYQPILTRITGTPHPPTHPEVIFERLVELPGDMTLAEALAAADPPPADEWLEEPFDVTDLDDGCDIFVRKKGRGVETRWEVTFAEPSAVAASPELTESIAALQDASFDVLEHLEAAYRPFDLALYLEGCRRNKVPVSDAVRAKLEAIRR